MSAENVWRNRFDSIDTIVWKYRDIDIDNDTFKKISR